ncbi:MAG: glycoside hydrolase family 66 protein [Bacteroidota bacterium]|nr:MAG: glycoside hydrolase family 66 protein [Bacteroidota bacterium]
MMKFLLSFFMLVLLTCCKPDPTPALPVTQSITISCNKASYLPGSEVKFELSRTFEGICRIRQLGVMIQEIAVSGKSFTWTCSSKDFQGYMAELYTNSSEGEKLMATIGIDVSSSWSKFPRYGFLSDFGNLDQSEMQEVIKFLNRHHINGLQFYDWQFKHHFPLAGTTQNPLPVWNDIINKPVYFATLESYIDLAHTHRMQAMFYNLAFGALDDAASDGVLPEWYLFSDAQHTNIDYHPLPKPPFKSDIFLINPANTGWQQYLAEKNTGVYQALEFDGFHIDQLGDRGARYDYWGNSVNLPQAYASFIAAMKTGSPTKELIMNAVNQYGQADIANSQIEFLYTEVWGPNENYSSLAQLIKNNNGYSNNKLSTVLAAYMNYELANNAGYFNTPGVLLTNAVIFSHGGAHLELGEHMLGKEYFPNKNLTMKDDLKKPLMQYYDFLVAYQNLLRDGGSFNMPELSSNESRVVLQNWPPAIGKVATFGKDFEHCQVIHLINFTNAIHLEWRDKLGAQSYPEVINNIEVSFTESKPVKNIWFASPDYLYGAAQVLEFEQSGNTYTFNLPILQYWSMVVAEYE